MLLPKPYKSTEVYIIIWTEQTLSSKMKWGDIAG